MQEQLVGNGQAVAAIDRVITALTPAMPPPRLLPLLSRSPLGQSRIPGLAARRRASALQGERVERRALSKVERTGGGKCSQGSQPADASRARAVQGAAPRPGAGESACQDGPHLVAVAVPSDRKSTEKSLVNADLQRERSR